jgi:hypothetical protein
MRLTATLTAGAALFFARAADACPFCGTETSRQVRASIFNEQFWETAAGVAAPFPVLVAVAGVVCYVVDRPRRG